MHDERARPGPGSQPPTDGTSTRPYDPGWCLTHDGGEDGQRVAESLFCLADGVVGTRGALEEDRDPGLPAVTASGLYAPSPESGERLMTLPSWFDLPLEAGTPVGTRTLDLRDGTLTRSVVVDGLPVLRTVRFASARRPGTAVLMAQVGHHVVRDRPRAPATSTSTGECPSPLGGGAVVASSTSWSVAAREDRRMDMDRIAIHLVSPLRKPSRRRAVQALGEAVSAGATTLLAEQRATWDRRWAGADVEAVGDPRSTLAARFAIFHLLSSVRERGETAVGARGLTGPAYAGHVFWDTDVFMFPALAATASRKARSVLEYRIRRLAAARRRAEMAGRGGARFPWESGRSGADVTPTSRVDGDGRAVPIRTGELEEHVTADVAWAAWRYAAWIGDWSFLTGPGRPLVVESARYWASRIRRDAEGRGHIDSVIGPDEYHEAVDDNAFTNLMARWTLRRAADLIARSGPVHDEAAEAETWRDAADALVDNLDPSTGLYQQFTGFDRLRSIVATDLGRPPFAADLALGAARVAETQIIKQADVLMAQLLIPEGVAPGSLGPNLDHYLPRTSHGSSLSPAVHAALLARAGRPADALDHLRMAVAIDLDDSTGTTGDGLHLGNLGGIWQAMVYGFAGLSVVDPDDASLSLEPNLPEAWEELRVRVRWHRRGVRLVCRPDAVYVGCDRPLRVTVHGTPARIEPPGRWVP